MKTYKQYLYYLVTIFIFVISLMGTRAKAATQANAFNKQTQNIEKTIKQLPKVVIQHTDNEKELTKLIQEKINTIQENISLNQKKEKPNTEYTNIPLRSLEGQRKKAIVVGATSGMGRQVAKLLGNEGNYEVGLVGRRVHLLESLQEEIRTPTYIKRIDVTQQQEAIGLLKELIEEMGNLDLILISISSFLSQNTTSSLEYDTQLIDVDIKGFLSMAHVALEVFLEQKHGHLVGISSIDGVRGSAQGPAYSGAKSFVSKYLEGTRNKMIQNKIPIYVTDIIPGWVDNEKVTFSEQPKTYWVVKAEKAARQIFSAIQKKKKTAYISKRWWLIAILLKIVPDCIYNAMGGF